MVGACVAGSLSCGRHGLTCETILRCAVLMHLRGYSYRQLEFALADSASARRFARVDPWHPPKKSALQSAIGALDAATWQALNGVLVQDAKQRGIESGTQVRIDSTATDADILEPSDSRLLYDGVRVLTGLLREAHKRLPHVVVRDHCRAAKRPCMIKTGSPIEKAHIEIRFLTSPLPPSQPPRGGSAIQAPHVPRTPRTLNAVSEVVLAQLYLLRRDGHRASRCEKQSIPVDVNSTCVAPAPGRVCQFLPLFAVRGIPHVIAIAFGPNLSWVVRHSSVPS